jgi:arylsulfatase A-like enzyme
MRLLAFLLGTLFSIQLFAQNTAPPEIVEQKIVYKTSKASEVFLVWTMDNWKVPTKEYQLPGTYIKNGMAYSNMGSNNGQFEITLRLPKGIYMDFMIWASKDAEGKEVEGWDNNWGSSYNLYIDGKNESRLITDEKLSIVAKQEIKEKPTNLLEKGGLVLSIGAVILLIGLSLKLITGRSHTLKNNYLYYLSAFVLSTYLLMIACRLQINGWDKKHLIFALTSKDLLFLLFIGAFFGLSLFISRGQKILHLVIVSLFTIIILATCTFALLNISIVQQLGKPLTYNWLYYSDFLKSTDAKNAMKAGFTASLIKNLAFILIGVTLASFGMKFVMNQFPKVSKYGLLSCSLLIVFVVTTSFIQLKSNKLDEGKIDNPVVALVGSWLKSEEQGQLFTMKVPAETMKLIEEMHTAHVNDPIAGADSITNVIVFVLESTPANLVQVYDSTYRVTPNIDKWKKHARIYDNMYAHLPNTPNTMLSLVSGIYPMISYKSIVNEKPDISIPSLPAVLLKGGFQTSLFFSSDLSFSNMGKYAKYQQFQTIEDAKTMPCTMKKFSSNYAQLDGLNDNCIVSSYVAWKKTRPGKTFSMLWTNQTHYPYFYSAPENKLAENVELNKYLNALSEVDAAFGKLMNGLEQRNELNNTLVIVIGDHGEAFGTHNQYTHGANIYEENMHVPCMLINPKLFNGERDEHISGMIDIAPTITHALRIPQPKEWEGGSLLGSYKRDHAFFIGPYADFQFGSRFGKWKMIYNAANGEFKLFDIVKDRKELSNLASRYPKVIKNEYRNISGWVQYHNNQLIKLNVK